MTTPTKAPTEPHIWLAEDDADLRSLIARVLRRRGLNVTEFTNGREVVDAIKSQDLPDMLVTDHHMPLLNGLDAVDCLRQENADLPVLVVTAFAESDLIARAKALNAQLVSKPCDVYALRDLVLRQLQA